jgi:hypothetical protein
MPQVPGAVIAVLEEDVVTGMLDLYQYGKAVRLLNANTAVGATMEGGRGIGLSPRFSGRPTCCHMVTG